MLTTPPARRAATAGGWRWGVPPDIGKSLAPTWIVGTTWIGRRTTNCHPTMRMERRPIGLCPEDADRAADDGTMRLT